MSINVLLANEFPLKLFTAKRAMKLICLQVSSHSIILFSRVMHSAEMPFQIWFPKKSFQTELASNRQFFLYVIPLNVSEYIFFSGKAIVTMITTERTKAIAVMYLSVISQLCCSDIILSTILKNKHYIFLHKILIS